MDLMDLLKKAGGDSSVGALSQRLNLDSAQTQSMLEAVAPAFKRSFQKEASSADGLAALARALESGDHDKYVDRPDALTSDAAVDDGNRILGHLFGSKDVSRNVAANAAEKSGIDPSLIKQALPLIAGLAMGSLSKNSEGGKSAFSMLPALLGGGGDDDGFGVDDVLSLARKFF